MWLQSWPASCELHSLACKKINSPCRAEELKNNTFVMLEAINFNKTTSQDDTHRCYFLRFTEKICHIIIDIWELDKNNQHSRRTRIPVDRPPFGESDCWVALWCISYPAIDSENRFCRWIIKIASTVLTPTHTLVSLYGLDELAPWRRCRSASPGTLNTTFGTVVGSTGAGW